MIFLVVSALLGTLGIIALIRRKTLLGILMGMQLLTLGASLVFVSAGVLSNTHNKAHVFGIFIILGGLAQLATGYAFALRLFLLKKSIAMDKVRSLKQ